MYRSKIFFNILEKWPGKKTFGIYRFMPAFFLLGAALEFTMINWDYHGQVNFYRTFKRRQVEKIVAEALNNEGKLN